MVEGLAYHYEQPPQHTCGTPEPCKGMVQFVGYVVILPLICLVGAVLNGLNLAVFKQRDLKFNDSTLVFLSWMAAMDLATLIIVLNIGFCRCINNVDNASKFAQDIYEVYIFLPVSNITGCTSVWTTVVITLERYVAVGHPTFARCPITRRNAGVTSIVLLCASFVLHFPYFFHQSISPGSVPRYTEFGESMGYVVYSWIRLVLAKMIPIFLVGVINSLLVYSAWRAHKRGGKIGKNKEELQFKITIMTLCISTTFFICHFLEPFAHYGIQSTIFGECSLSTVRYTIFVMIINILEMISFSINFIFYCLFNPRFFQALRLLFKSNIERIVSRSDQTDNEHSCTDDDTQTSSSRRDQRSEQSTIATVTSQEEKSHVNQNFVLNSTWI